MPRYFHVTPSVNLPSIRQSGLIPTIGANSRACSESSPRVWAFSDPLAVEDALMGWLGEAFDTEPLALLAFESPEIVDPGPAGWEVGLRCAIPASAIEILAEDLDAILDFRGLVGETAPHL